MEFNINTDAVVSFTNTLEKMGKTMLPDVIRGTLNDAVYDVKTKTMPAASGVFIHRSKNFFKANSKFEKATGNNIGGMRATVGFFSNNLIGSSNYAVRDLQQQEKGGTIEGRSFIPLDSARTSGSHTKMVRPNARLNAIKRIVKAKNQKGKTKAEKFVNAVLKAGTGGFVLSSNSNGDNILWRVDALKSNVKRKKFEPKLTALYDYSKDRSIKIKRPTHFMQKATIMSAKKLDGFFLVRANRKIKSLAK